MKKIIFFQTIVIVFLCLSLFYTYKVLIAEKEKHAAEQQYFTDILWCHLHDPSIYTGDIIGTQGNLRLK